MNIVNRVLAASGVVWLWLLIEAPRVAQACSVCTAGRDEENQLAFLLSTIFMSLLPLLAIGTLVGVLWRRIKKLEAETARQAGASAQPPAAGA
jgi:hypothetical protein